MQLREMLLRALDGAYGAVRRRSNLMRSFRSMCAWSSNNVCAAEFVRGLEAVGLGSLSKVECQRLFEGIDADADGLVHFDDFERFLSGEASSARSGERGARPDVGPVESELEREVEALQNDRTRRSARHTAEPQPVLRRALRDPWMDGGSGRI